MPNTGTNLGTVKWFDTKKGFGFIIGPGGKDVFVHFTRIVGEGFRSLRDGEEVEYEHTEGDKGLLATMVRRPIGSDLTGGMNANIAQQASIEAASQQMAH